MYYEFTAFYKRDTYFVYSEDNAIDWIEFETGGSKKNIQQIIYNVDKIDTYIDKYDVLPTMGLPLVSSKFKEVFTDLISIDIEFFSTTIIDEKGNKNENFYAMNILNVIPCLDKEKSIIETKEYGITIKKLRIIPNALKNYSIARMEEHASYIIVTEDFKRKSNEGKLKGIKFISE